jgi:hypothetical protein
MSANTLMKHTYINYPFYATSWSIASLNSLPNLLPIF